MGKKRSWFTYVKRLFIPQGSQPRSRKEEKSKKWKWFLERLMIRKCPALEASQGNLNEATEEQHKRALAVAMATAAAAEAAVAAANAAAEVVLLTNTPYGVERKNQQLAAIRIQCAYRGHLARKALSALKGLVKLQAVIRGELVRRRVVKRLVSTSFFSRAEEPQVHQLRSATLLDYLSLSETTHSPSQRVKYEELKLQCKTHMDWDLSLVKKEAMEKLYLRKQEAIAKRQRMKQYSFSHREGKNDHRLCELISRKEKNSSRFDRCVEVKSHQHKETDGLKQLKLRSFHKQLMLEESNSPSSLHRRSFCHVKNKSSEGDGSLPNSPVFPAYMAATESAKAKSRSLSTPKQRLRLCDTYCGQHSPYKLTLSSWSSFNGDISNNDKRNSIPQQISANLGSHH